MTAVLEQPREPLFKGIMEYKNRTLDFIEKTPRVRCLGIYFVDLGNPEGSIQSGVRPCIVISNNKNNKYSPTVLVIPFTSKTKNDLPVHVDFYEEECGLPKDSTLLCEQILTVQKCKVKECIGEVSKFIDIMRIVKALLIQIPLFSMIGIKL